MKVKFVLFSSALFFLINAVYSQPVYSIGSEWYFDNISGQGASICNINSINTPKHKFDVLDYKINVDIYNCYISPYPKSFTGSVIIKFRVDTALSSITLNAVNTSLQINSVGMAGISFTHANNILTVNLDRTYNPNEIVNVRIDYQHLNVIDNAFYTSNGFVFTDCPPEGARKWFPCWDKPSDKATLDLTAKVPLSAKFGSNGRLNDSLITGDTIYYHWISRDPIATYLMVMTGKVNYNLDIVFWHKLSNPNDSIPARFYFNSGENISAAKTRIIPMTTFYSQKFGEYPFEKIGFATLNNQFPWAGMENQTLISLCSNCWSDNLMSHEFAHMWFGDAITCGTWADVWLNEGFASYCEALWLENTSGYASYKNRINYFANNYFSGTIHLPIYNPSWAEYTPGIDTLYDYGITYCKGACVLHMLRYTIGDSLFFAVLNSYATDTVNFKNKNAVTDDFTAKLNQVAGQDLTWFMDEWVKQPYHPIYANTYAISSLGGGNWQVSFVAKQTQTNTPFHKMPIQVRVSFTSGPDTTIRVMNDVNNQEYYWTFDRQPNTTGGVTFDPGNDIVLKQGSTTIGIPGAVEIPLKYALYQNFPNPFNPVTKISFDLPEKNNVTIKVYDVLGRLIKVLLNEVRVAGSYSVTFDGTNLSSGVYYYDIKSGNYSASKKMALIK